MAATPERAANVGAMPAGPVAVIDIGSNSIRLVVFSGLERGAATLFNEKVLCGLGRGLASSGRLHPQGRIMARDNLVRFTRLAKAMGARRIDLLATAAVREATDGSAFVAEIEELCAQPVRVLDGVEEARLSALGVLAGYPAARGVMGDLGGGSLELVELRDGQVGRSQIGRTATLRLGPFALMERFAGDPAGMRTEIDAQLAAAGWLDERTVDAAEPATETFYPVGGAWRSLARIHMQQGGYPLHVVHGYPMSRAQVDAMCDVIGRLSEPTLSRIEGITRSRLETLPAAAMVLSRVLRALHGRDVVFSAFGLREGHLFDLLDPTERGRDPLVAVAADMARRAARFDGMGEDLLAWTDGLFVEDNEADRRLRRVSCLLSDIAWREHPDNRAGQAVVRILHYPFSAIDHGERVFLAAAIHARYGGVANGPEIAPYLGLIAAEAANRARILGLAQRLAYRVSGASGAVLKNSALTYDPTAGTLRLSPPNGSGTAGGDELRQRFDRLAEVLGVTRAKIVG